MNLQVIGLIYDAAGISILGGPAVFRMVDEIRAQSGTYWNGNPALARALSLARIDTTVGSLLLLSGFIIQITALQGYTVPPVVIDILVPVLVIFVLLYWLCIRSLLSESLVNRVAEQRQGRQEERSDRTDS